MGLRKLLLKKSAGTLRADKRRKARKAIRFYKPLFCLGESRFGLMSRRRGVLTLRGIKPLIPYQHSFKNFYLFGCFSPKDGHSFLLELPQCNTEAFQCYLEQFSGQKPEEFKIIVLDNGAFHQAKSLVIPHHIALLFLPPYSPELNPAEKIWRHLKDALGNHLAKTLDQLSDTLKNRINAFTPEQVKPITAYSFYLNAMMTTFYV